MDSPTLYIGVTDRTVTFSDDRECLPASSQVTDSHRLFGQPCFFDFFRAYKRNGYEIHLNLSNEFEEWLEETI